MTGPELKTIYARNVLTAAGRKGVTKQSELAELVGLSRGSIYRIFREESRFIDPEVLCRLAELFECPPAELLTEHEGVKYFQ